MARTNREALLAALAAYRESIGALEDCVAGQHWDGLAAQLATAQALRPAFLGVGSPRPEPGSET
jgi:arogenate dehydrogenase (NADP+)